MALVKGKFVDKEIPIQSNSDPVDTKDLARKSYVDQKASAEASAKVDKAGDEMSGNLLVKNDLIATGFTAEIAPGNFIAKKMSEDGEEVLGLSSLDCGSVTIIGPGGLPGVPTEESHATTKKYVDDLLASIDLSGKADLVDGKVPSSQLPGYVDDVEEYASLGSFPPEGSAGKLYVAQDTNKVYRWSGTVYIEIVGSPGSTDEVAEGSVNLYFTDARAQAALASALSGKVSKAGDTMTGELILQGGLTTLNPINGFNSSGEQTLILAPEDAAFRLRRDNFETFATPNYVYVAKIDPETSEYFKTSTFILDGRIELYDENLNPALPVDPTQVTTKAYVDAAIGALSGGLSGKKEVFTLSATDISNGYVDCAHLAATDTMLVMSGGVVHVEGESYTLSVVGGKTRITFIGDLVDPSPSKLEAGDKVHIQYLK